MPDVLVRTWTHEMVLMAPMGGLRGLSPGRDYLVKLDAPVLDAFLGGFVRWEAPRDITDQVPHGRVMGEMAELLGLESTRDQDTLDLLNAHREILRNNPQSDKRRELDRLVQERLGGPCGETAVARLIDECAAYLHEQDRKATTDEEREQLRASARERLCALARNAPDSVDKVSVDLDGAIGTARDVQTRTEALLNLQTERLGFDDPDGPGEGALAALRRAESLLEYAQYYLRRAGHLLGGEAATPGTGVKP